MDSYKANGADSVVDTSRRGLKNINILLETGVATMGSYLNISGDDDFINKSSTVSNCKVTMSLYLKTFNGLVDVFLANILSCFNQQRYVTILE